MSYFCYTRLYVVIDLSQLSHTVEDRAFSRLVRRIPVDVVRNTARVSAIVRWSGKQATCYSYKLLDYKFSAEDKKNYMFTPQDTSTKKRCRAC